MCTYPNSNLCACECVISLTAQLRTFSCFVQSRERIKENLETTWLDQLAAFCGSIRLPLPDHDVSADNPRSMFNVGESARTDGSLVG